MSAPSVTRNEALSGIEVRFPRKPSPAVIAGLRAAGFRWSQAGWLWWAYSGNPSAEAWVLANTADPPMEMPDTRREGGGPSPGATADAPPRLPGGRAPEPTVVDPVKFAGTLAEIRGRLWLAAERAGLGLPALAERVRVTQTQVWPLTGPERSA